MDRLGYFGHVAIVAHPSFQLILLLPPEFRLGEGKKGRKRDRKNSLKRVLISYLPETGLSLRSCRDASDDLPASRDGWGDRVVNSPPIFAK